jgi:hypothetical protein
MSSHHPSYLSPVETWRLLPRIRWPKSNILPDSGLQHLHNWPAWSVRRRADWLKLVPRDYWKNVTQSCAWGGQGALSAAVSWPEAETWRPEIVGVRASKIKGKMRMQKGGRRRATHSRFIYFVLAPDMARFPIGMGLGALHRIEAHYPQRGRATPAMRGTREPASAAQIEILLLSNSALINRLFIEILSIRCFP